MDVELGRLGRIHDERRRGRNAPNTSAKPRLTPVGRPDSGSGYTTMTLSDAIQNKNGRPLRPPMNDLLVLCCIETGFYLTAGLLLKRTTESNQEHL